MAPRERYQALDLPNVYSAKKLRAEFDRVQRAIPHADGADVRDFGAAGNYDATNNAGRDDTADLQKAFAASDVIKLAPYKNYRITDQLDWSNKTVLMNGATIWRTDNTDETAIAATGTVGSYSDLDSNADAGQNVLACAALAGSVVAGDLVKVSSTAAFISGGTILQGEMAMVRTVNGDNIILESPLWDSYTTANGAKVAKVTPALLTVYGKLRIRRVTTALAQQTRGIALAYCLAPDLDIDLRNCTRIGVSLDSCFAPRLKVHTENNYFTSSGISYGVAIDNATMYADVRGFASGVRHAVKHGGSASALGVSWGSRIHNFTGIGADADAIFDAHEETGGATFDNCTAIGGTIDDGTGSTSTRPGFSLGARYSEVLDCHAIRCDEAVAFRGGSQTVERFTVRNLRITAGKSHGVIINETGTIKQLRVDGVKGDLPSGSGGTSFYGVSVAGTTISEVLEIDNVSIYGGSAVNVSSASVPASLRFKNVECEDTSVPTSTIAAAWRGITIATDITELELVNPRVKNKSLGLRITGDITRLILVNADFDANYQHIYVDNDALDNLTAHGGKFRNSKNGVSTLGVCRILNGNAVTTVEVNGVLVDTDAFFVGGHNSASVATIVHAPCQFPSGFAVARTLASGWLEYVGGSTNSARVIRGDGDPDTVVTAPLSCIFERADGSAGTLLYVNDDGSTSWTAFA